jgi:hypothetical protein
MDFGLYINYVKIGGIVYTIKKVDNLCDRDGNKADGILKHGTTEILLDSGLNIQAYMQTLLHEIFHAILTQIGRGEEEDSFVDALAFQWMAVLRSPDFVKSISEMCWKKGQKE